MKNAGTESAASNDGREIRIEHLLGRPVLGGNNQNVGRLEEFRVEAHRDSYLVTDYVIGEAGLFERLGVGFKLLFGRRGGGYIARWDQLDISDPDRPRLKCPLEELRKL
jgi:hypothetical protein